MFAILRSRPAGEGTLIETPGFAQGLGREDYYALLAESVLVPCPSGPFTPETFRFYEALEAGCIPIPAATAPCGGWPKDFNYWDWRYPDFQFPTLADLEFALCGNLDDDGNETAFHQEYMTRCLAWWIGQKRRYVHDLLDDCRDLGADIPAEKVSVVITCSPVPSHPSVDMLAQVIARIRAYPELRSAEVLICCDGVRREMEHRRNDYEEFKRVMVDRCNWDPTWFGCLPIINTEWVHQAEMVRRALAMVRTPLVFFVEHDTFPMGEIPFQLLMGQMLHDGNPTGRQEANHIRLHIFDRILYEHQHLYGPTDYPEWGPLIETRQYSFRPHLARTDWMRSVMQRYFPKGFKGFVEDTLTSPAEGGDLGGLYVYAPGDMLRSGTFDGRGTDPKAPHGEAE